MSTSAPKTLIRWTLVLAAVATFACRPEAPPGVVASTSLGDVTFAELEAHILTLPGDRQAPPAGTTPADWRRSVLEELIVSRALIAEARELELAADPEARTSIQARKDALLADTLRRRLVEERAQVTEEDLQAFYDENPGEFSHPEQLRVRNLFVRVDRDASEDTRQEARDEIEDLLRQLERGARFEDLARLHSDSETAQHGGLIGRLDRGVLDPTLERILWDLGEGEVSDILETPVGFHLFLVEDQLGAFHMPFDEARTRLHRRLSREATEEAERQLVSELIAESRATYEPDNLESDDLSSVLFQNGDTTLTLADFVDQLESRGFSTARETSLQEQLQKHVLSQLCLWKANESGLAEETEMAGQLERIDREADLTLAHQRRLQEAVEEVDDSVLRQTYESRAERFQTPRLIHLHLLTRDFPETGSWYRVFEDLQQLAAEIRAGRVDFEEEALRRSDDLSSVRKGDIGRVRADAIAEWAGPQTQKGVLALEPGEVSEPLLIERYNRHRMTYDRQGYALFRLDSIDEPRIRPFEEVRDQVEAIYAEHEPGFQERIRQEILASVEAEIFPENL